MDHGTNSNNNNNNCSSSKCRKCCCHCWHQQNNNNNNHSFYKSHFSLTKDFGRPKGGKPKSCYIDEEEDFLWDQEHYHRFNNFGDNSVAAKKRQKAMFRSQPEWLNIEKSVRFHLPQKGHMSLGPSQPSPRSMPPNLPPPSMLKERRENNSCSNLNFEFEKGVEEEEFCPASFVREVESAAANYDLHDHDDVIEDEDSCGHGHKIIVKSPNGKKSAKQDQKSNNQGTEVVGKRSFKLLGHKKSIFGQRFLWDSNSKKKSNSTAALNDSKSDMASSVEAKKSLSDQNNNSQSNNNNNKVGDESSTGKNSSGESDPGYESDPANVKGLNKSDIHLDGGNNSLQQQAQLVTNSTPTVGFFGEDLAPVTMQLIAPIRVRRIMQ